MKLYSILLAGSLASTAFDVESTFNVSSRCANCVEMNPVLRPFIKSRAQTYTAQMGLSTTAAYGSWQLKDSGKKWWWVPLAANIAVHVGAGIHNRKVAPIRGPVLRTVE